MQAVHVPVLVNEVLQYLRPGPGQTIVDGTVGLGGHSLKLLEAMQGEGRLIAIDRDREALKRAEEKLNDYKRICSFHNADFAELDTIMKEVGVTEINGCLLDLGVSTMQVLSPERGFSYRDNGPLDMRMGQHSGPTAADVVNSYSREELMRVFREYSDERHPARVADAILNARKAGPITETGSLARILRRPAASRKGTRYPEAALFQAIRIEVNNEFDSIRKGMRNMLQALAPGGRLAVISFHSGEDRLAKYLFREEKEAGRIDILTKKPVTASREEVHGNPKARTAKLRAAERRAG